MTVIPLRTIIYNISARDGTWCMHPYENHRRGCPNFEKGCTRRKQPFNEIPFEKYEWYAVIEEFDLKAHANKLKQIYPYWTERQCRNPLYWQGSVRKKLTKQAEDFRWNKSIHSILLNIPEAHGVDVFETMHLHGIILERKPDLVKKVMIVGIEK